MKLSVCLTTYNGSFFIREQIDSILCQLGENDELIISDDGSTDDTITIINSYKDERIRLIHNIQQKIGQRSHVLVSNNFGNVLSYASGDFIFLSDQDDIWFPGKVSKMLLYLRTYDLVISDALVIRDNKVTDELLFMQNSPIRSLFNNTYRIKYYGCCLAFNKRVLTWILPFPNKLPIHDGWIGLLAQYCGSVYYLNIPLIYYRIHSRNVSQGYNKNSLIYRVSYRFSFFLNLLYRIFKIKIVNRWIK